MSDPVGNPEDRFSHDEAHIMTDPRIKHTFYICLLGKCASDRASRLTLAITIYYVLDFFICLLKKSENLNILLAVVN